MNLLESSDYDKQIQSNGFSEYSYNSFFSSYTLSSERTRRRLT